MTSTQNVHTSRLTTLPVAAAAGSFRKAVQRPGDDGTNTLLPRCQPTVAMVSTHCCHGAQHFRRWPQDSKTCTASRSRCRVLHPARFYKRALRRQRARNGNKAPSRRKRDTSRWKRDTSRRKRDRRDSKNKNSILHPRYNYIGNPYLSLITCVAVALPYAKAAFSLPFPPLYVGFS